MYFLQHTWVSTYLLYISSFQRGLQKGLTVKQRKKKNKAKKKKKTKQKTRRPYSFEIRILRDINCLSVVRHGTIHVIGKIVDLKPGRLTRYTHC